MTTAMSWDEVLFYDPSQPRDANGRWSSGGSGSSNAPSFDGSRYATERQELDAIRDLVMESASKDELSAAEDYAGSWVACNNMNGILRYGMPKDDPRGAYASAQKRAAALKDLIDRTPPISREMEVQRGVTYKPDDWGAAGSLAGQTIKDNGFISTTMDDQIAQDFSGEAGEGAIMKIKVPAGAKLFPLSRINTRDSDWSSGDYVSDAPNQEFLLPPGTQFRVLSDRMSYNKRRELEVEVIA